MSAHKIEKESLPKEGVEIAASKGNKFTRVHLDLAGDGITLAMVGAASSMRDDASRHKLVLKPAPEGISLSVVGAASSLR